LYGIRKRAAAHLVVAFVALALFFGVSLSPSSPST